jgi:hypothetical protein
MMLLYALERRGLASFSPLRSAAPSSLYGFLSGAWPFGVVEAIWTAVALQRFRRVRARPAEAVISGRPVEPLE